jgi:spermidine synthase
MRKNRYLYLTVFTSGMTTLAIELTASRLLGNIFGTSNLVWANIIGLMLIYLTVGYFIGGRWADRSPYHHTLYQIIILGAFLSGVVPLVSRPVLRFAAEAVNDLEAGLALGSFVGVLVLFSVPVTLLGTVSPFAIRLAMENVDKEKAGEISGSIYALSTLGSIIGTFLPVLVITPAVGTTRTFLVFSGVLLLVAFVGLWQTRRTSTFRWLWMPPVLVLLAALTLSGPVKPAPPGMRLLYEKDSAYNLIQIVEEEDGTRYLLLNEGQGYHSQWHPEQLYYRRTWSYFLTGPYFNADYLPQDVNNLAIIGLAGGTIARQYTAVYGDIPIDGIEIDPEIVEASRDYLGLTMPNLNVIIQDGRYAFNRQDNQYSVVGIDAYRVPYVPWHLTTVEFFEEIRDKLTDDGVVIINVGRTRNDRRLVEAMATTMQEVYPSLYAMDVPESFNTILVATKQPTQVENLAKNIAMIDPEAYPLLYTALTTARDTLVPVTTSDVLFTDDHAPVEQIVDDMVIDYLLQGEG